MGVWTIGRKAINSWVDSSFCAGPGQATSLRQTVGELYKVFEENGRWR